MDAYVYKAALLCESCGESVRNELTRDGLAPADPDDEESYDSDDYPKGPCPDGGGEADGPQHCDHCGEFLENPLTDDGSTYVAEAIAEAITRGRVTDTIRQWAEFYSVAI